MEQWQKYKLGDFMRFNPIEKIKKGQIARKISMDLLTPFCRYAYSNNYEPYNGGAKFRNGDTIMARITPCLENGKTAYISSLDKSEAAFGSTEYIVLRNIDGVSDSLFIYYLAISRKIREIAIKSMVGSSGRQRVQQGVLENHEIVLPSLPEQKRIADILKSLDDKIELNRRINDNLEQQAQALFKSWFVDNTHLLGDFTEGKLTDIADFLNGLAMQKFRPSSNEAGIPVLKIKELGQGFCDEKSDLCSPLIKSQYIISDGDVVFSWSGTLMIDTWCGGKCGLNQHLFKVSSDLYPQWFLYLWTNHHLSNFIRIAKDKAVTMGHIKRSDLDNSIIIIPNKFMISKLDAIFSPILNKMISSRVENGRLSNLRDALLPKLMSGELKTNDLNS